MRVDEGTRVVSVALVPHDEEDEVEAEAAAQHTAEAKPEE